MDSQSLTDQYVSEKNTIQTIDHKDFIDISISLLFLSIPGGIVFPSLLRFIKWTMIKTLLNNK